MSDLLNGNKVKTLYTIAGLIFACGMVYMIIQNTTKHTHANTNAIDYAEKQLNQVSQDVVRLQADVEYIKKGIDRIENKLER